MSTRRHGGNYGMTVSNMPNTAKSEGLNGGDCFDIGRVVGKSQLDKNVAIQANHGRPNISSAKSPWEIFGVRTR
jgi:hypothetical protein